MPLQGNFTLKQKIYNISPRQHLTINNGRHFMNKRTGNNQTIPSVNATIVH